MNIIINNIKTFSKALLSLLKLGLILKTMYKYIIKGINNIYEINLLFAKTNQHTPKYA